jgi:uncharacterized membrane protein (DUF373 family)
LNDKSSQIKKFEVGFEHIVIRVIQLLLIYVILLTLAELSWLLIVKSIEQLRAMESVPDLQREVQQAFAGILLVMVGLELLDTLRAYSTTHRIRLELIMIVSIIALGRHIIQLDFERVDGLFLGGLGALTLAACGGYFLIRRAGSEGGPPASG